MQQTHEAAPPPGDDRQVGARGEQFGVAVVALLAVFVLGFAVIGVVLLSRRRPPR